MVNIDDDDEQQQAGGPRDLLPVGSNKASGKLRFLPLEFTWVTLLSPFYEPSQKSVVLLVEAETSGWSPRPKPPVTSLESSLVHLANLFLQGHVDASSPADPKRTIVLSCKEEKLQEYNDRLRAEVDRLQAEVRDSDSLQSSLQMCLEDVTISLRDLEYSLQLLTSSYVDFQNKASRLEGDLNNAHDQLASIEVSWDRLRARCQKLRLYHDLAILKTRKDTLEEAIAEGFDLLTSFLEAEIDLKAAELGLEYIRGPKGNGHGSEDFGSSPAAGANPRI